MNQKFTNVILAAANAVIWGAVVEFGIAIFTRQLAGWLTIVIMVCVFLATLAGLNWFTSDSR